MVEKSSRIFVTGGTGFFGRALLRTLMARESSGETPPRLTILTRSSSVFLTQYPEFSGVRWIEWVEGDVCNAQSLPCHESFTHILHAATESTLGPLLTPLQCYDQIVNGTRNMLCFATKCGAQSFLFTSSGAVYGRQPLQMERIPETYHGIPDPLEPCNAYGIAKRSAEHLCALYGQAFGVRAVIARCFAFVGEDLPLDVHYAIGNFVRDALWRNEITVGGDGSPLRSYLDQRDLAHWLLTLLEHGKAGNAYNVGSDCAISVADLAHLVRDIVSPGKPVRILGQAKPDASRNRYVPDVRRAREELGLNVCIPLNIAVRAMAEAAQRRGNSR